MLPNWISAGAAVAQAIAAIVIFVVTRKYVALTADLAKSATQQVALASASISIERTANSTEVLQRARSLELALVEIPENHPANDFDRRIRTVALWRDEDVRALSSSAARLGPDFVEHAAQVSASLNWLAHQASVVRATSRQQGFDYSHFPAGWPAQWSNAQHHLKAISAGVESYLSQLPKLLGGSAV